MHTFTVRTRQRNEFADITRHVAALVSESGLNEGACLIYTPHTTCGVTINVCLQTVKALATLMAPFLPFSAVKVAEMLKLDDPSLPWQETMTELPAGHGLGEPVILFKKLDAAELFGDSEG